MAVSANFMANVGEIQRVFMRLFIFMTFGQNILVLLLQSSHNWCPK